MRNPMQRLGQWQWLVWWAPLWIPFALLMIWAIYLIVFVDQGALRWIKENVLFC